MAYWGDEPRMFQVTFPLFVVTRQSFAAPAPPAPPTHLKLIAVPDSNQIWHAALFSSEGAARHFIGQTAAPDEHQALAIDLQQLVAVLRELAAQQVEWVVLDPGSAQALSGTLVDLLERLSAGSN